MPIKFKNSKFHLYNDDMSYVIEISKHSDIITLHFGSPVEDEEITYQKNIVNGFFCHPDNEVMFKYSLSHLPQEYPSSGASDFRSPAYEITTAKGFSTPELKYVSYEVVKGKPALSGLPSTYVEKDDEAETLIILTEDKTHEIQVKLYYTIYEELNVICRHSEIINTSENVLTLRNAQSVSLDFPAQEYEYIHLEGAWAREKHIDRNIVHKGEQGFESRRGASGHTENPFLMFFDKGSNEDYGNVYGISLVYSGNHKFLMEKEFNETVRVQAGINPFNFNFKLGSGESFVTPEAVLVYSDCGFAKMSHTFHKLYRTRLCRGKWRDEVRPILINNWEATYFNFNREKLLNIADAAAKIGIELFVLDDGWFGYKRDDELSSIGDWFANEKKLGGSLASLAKEMNEKGLKFGIWFEPENVSQDSELFRNHPEWCVQAQGAGRVHLGRYTCVLDFAQSEVRDYIVDTLSDVLEGANIEYVKWDMNRNITDAYTTSLPVDRQGEFYHRYILGLYDVLERLTQKFPDVLFEGCSGGGGRNDPGMLYYMPQNWTSDDTDATERLYIQYGGSIVYPCSTVGAHVSAVPNHQVGRTSLLSLRGTVAMNGAFGYELDLSKLSVEELSEMKSQVEFYKKNRELIMKGDYYRLKNPFESRHSAWMYVSEDKNRALVYYVVKTARPANEVMMLKLKGLNADYKYIIDGKIYTGKTLMNRGILLDTDEKDGDNFILDVIAYR